MQSGNGQNGVAMMRPFQNGELGAARGLDNFARLHRAMLDPGINNLGLGTLRDRHRELVGAVKNQGAVRA